MDCAWERGARGETDCARPNNDRRRESAVGGGVITNIGAPRRGRADFIVADAGGKLLTATREAVSSSTKFGRKLKRFLSRECAFTPAH